MIIFHWLHEKNSPTMKRQLPSFPSLRAFEAAARLLSFKKAAAELCVTQSAISHQVRLLEEFLEAPLFIRHPQRVELTLRGHEYLEMVSHLLDGLESATQRVKGSSHRGPLYLQASPAFASYWLLPRLIRFNRFYPEIDVHVATIARDDAPNEHPFDVRVNCSFEVPPDAGGERFMQSPHVPVCSPRLLESGPPIGAIDDLFHYPCVQAEGRWDIWDRWFASVEYPRPPTLQGPRFENTYLAIKAAEEGLGIALGPLAMIGEKLELGRLVIALDLRGASALYYTLSCIDGWQNKPRIVAFRQWLHDELGECSGMDMSAHAHALQAI